MTVEIHGNQYKTVAERIQEFRDEHGLDYSVNTTIIWQDDIKIIMRAEILKGGDVVSSGHAEETRTGNINSVSAIENGETSAVGRALAFFGYAGTEIASADELIQAEASKVQLNCWKRAKEHMQAVLNNYESIEYIKAGIRDEFASDVAAAWFELDQEDKKSLWLAPSKGGVFTTDERAFFQSSAYVEARNALNGITVEEE